MKPVNHMQYPTHDPEDQMTVEARARYMTTIHPSAMDEMGFRTREQLYVAHLKAAIRDASR
jgi:hypothetical protein